MMVNIEHANMQTLLGEQCNLPQYDGTPSGDPEHQDKRHEEVRGWFKCEPTDVPILCVCGPAGIGKSSLLATFAKQVSS